MPSTQVSHLLPPGPTEVFEINPDMETFDRLQDLRKRYGDICKITVKSRHKPAYVVNDPEYVKHILVTNQRNYAKGIGFERVKVLLGHGLIASDGELWRSQRRMMQPAFKERIIAQMSESMRQCNHRLLQRWETKAAQNEAINITEETSMLTLEVILRAIFSHDLDAMIASHGENPFSMVLQDTARDLQLVTKFRATAKLIKALMEQRRREDRREMDFLSLLMEAKDKTTGKPMQEKILIDEVFTLIIAGHETTAATLNWIWYLISQHPEVRRELEEEVDQLGTREAPHFEQLKRLVYTKWVMQEALRLYPPGWLFTRFALNEDWLGEYYVARETDLFISPYIVHRHPDYWEEPDAFRPERFSADAVQARNPYVYFPFSLGGRRCIGEFFAITEILIHMGLMLSHFRLETVSNQPVELDPAINLRTKRGIWMRAIKRKTFFN